MKKKSVLNLIKYYSEENDAGFRSEAYEIAKDCIKSKPAFPMDILLCSEANDITDFSNWEIPPYIREGLEWLREG